MPLLSTESILLFHTPDELKPLSVNVRKLHPETILKRLYHLELET